MTLALKQSRKDTNEFLPFKRGMLTAATLWFGCAGLAAAQQTVSTHQKHLVVTIDARQTMSTGCLSSTSAH